MKKRQFLFRLFSIVSTLLLTMSVFISSISAINVSSINGSKSAYENTSSRVVSNSKHATAQSKSSQEAFSKSSVAETKVNNYAATPSADDDTNTAGYMGKYQVTTASNYDPMNESKASDGLVDHFSVNDDIGKCYCYDWSAIAPDKPGQAYNGYNYWEQMNDTAGKQKAAEVSAALMGGYHLNKDTNKWEVSQAFQQEAQDSYNEFKNQMNQQNIMIPSNYSLDQFEQDCTQVAIWEIGGEQADYLQQGDYGRYLMSTQFTQDLVSYSENHPLNQQTAEASGLTVESNGKQVSANSPLTIDPTTLKSQSFEYSGYDGKIAVSNLDPNIQVVDSQTGKAVTSLEPNHSYYLQAKTLNTANKKQNFDMNFEKVAESHYFSPVDLNAGSSEAGNKYQNMVNLATKTMNLPITYVFASSSSSSEMASSKLSSKTSSIVSSSSIESNSSAKGSLLSKESSSSSIKSSSAKSSLSSKKAVVSSSKASSKIASSSEVSSSKKAVVSSSKASSKVASSSEVSSSKKAVVSSSKASSKVASSSEVSSSKKAVVSSSKASSKVASSSEVSSSKKAVVSSSKASSKKAIVTGVRHNSESGKGSGYGEGHGQGKGYGHGIPQTGEAAAASLVVVGVVLLATAGAITLRKRN